MWSRNNRTPVLYASVRGVEVPEIRGLLTSFKIKFSVQKSAEATLTFRNDDLQLLDDSRFFPNTPWSIRFGFLEDLSPNLAMVVRNFEPKMADARTVTVTLFDGSTAMAQNSSQKNWGAVPSSTVARLIAKKYGLEAEVTDSKDAPKKAIIQPGDVTDIHLLRSLAADIGYEVFVTQARLIYRPRPDGEPSERVLIYRDDPTARGYVLSFSPKLKSLGAVTKSGAAAASMDKGKADASKNANEKVQIDGETGGTSIVAPTQAKEGTTTPAAGNAAGIAAAARQQMLDKANEASSEHPLTPSLLVGKNYEWRGVGKQLSGKWYLNEVNHEIRGDGSKTTCEWKRNMQSKTTSNTKNDTSGGKATGTQVQLDGETGKTVVKLCQGETSRPPLRGRSTRRRSSTATGTTATTRASSALWMIPRSAGAFASGFLPSWALTTSP